MKLKLDDNAFYPQVEAARRPRSQPSVSRKKEKGRLSEEEFGHLSMAEKRRYLENYPSSKHNRQGAKAKQEAKTKSDKQNVDDRANIARGKMSVEQRAYQFNKKITREEFDKLDKKDQKAYLSKYPNDSFTGKKHFIAKKKGAAKKKKGPIDVSGLKDDKDTRANQNMSGARKSAKKELGKGITKGAVDAVTKIETRHVRNAADALSISKEENISTIRDSLASDYCVVDPSEESKSELIKVLDRNKEKWDPADYRRVVTLLERKSSGEEKRTTEDDKELLRRVRAMRAAEQDNENYTPFWKQDLSTTMKIMANESVTPEERSNAMLFTAEFVRFVLLSSGVVFFTTGASPAALQMTQDIFQSWDALQSEASAKESAEDNLNELYDMVVSHLKHMDVDDFVTDLKASFKEYSDTGMEVSASVDRGLFNDIIVTLRRLGCTITRRSETYLEGQNKNVEPKTLLDALTRTFAEHDYKTLIEDFDLETELKTRLVGKGRFFVDIMVSLATPTYYIHIDEWLEEPDWLEQYV